VHVALQVAYVVVVFVVIAVASVVSLRDSRQFKGSESWPPAQSTVEFIGVRRAGRSYYIGELAYSYSVQGEYYSGFCRCRFLSEKAAREFVETLRGKTITVQYNPEAPEVSVMSAAQCP
jgi:hypothetical protein